MNNADKDLWRRVSHPLYGHYAVSRIGEVRSLRTGRLIKHKHPGVVRLSGGGSSTDFKVVALVKDAFGEPLQASLTVEARCTEESESNHVSCERPHDVRLAFGSITVSSF